MDVGPYVPLLHRAVGKRCYFNYIAVDEAAVCSSHLSFRAVQEEQRAEVTDLEGGAVGVELV